MPFYVYILHSLKADRYYIGQTGDPEDRLRRHNAQEVPSTAPYAPWEMLLKIEKSSRSEAMILERKLKNLSRPRIAAFIEKYKP